uniref:CSON000056 protein n=1 Tax=Culicoides sonorensis TaxID=179676 RepID=A0A336MDU6_CULSO
MTDQEQQNGQDFTQDVKDGEDSQMNGNGDSQNGNSGPPARDDDRKLFVGGLSWETTEKELRDHFGQYGEIENINVKTDPNTGRSRGFAFIVYKTADALDKVQNAGDHIINNKKVDPKKAKARHGKIFIGGLTPEISDDEIKSFFGQFGNIVEVEMPFDKQKNQRKAFCFITFDSEQVVNELLKTPKQTIQGKEVDVKRATPKDGNAPGGFPMGPGGRFARGGPAGRGGPGGRGGKGFQQWGNQGYPPYSQYGSQAPYGYEGYGYNQGYYDYDQYGGYYSGYPSYETEGSDLAKTKYGDYNYGGSYGGRSGPRGGGKGGPNFQGGKTRGGRPQRHQPY